MTNQTTELTGVPIHVENCLICSSNRSVSEHHVVFRSHGGTDGPTVPVCLDCHNKVHDRWWDLVLDEADQSIRVYDRESGACVWRRTAWPEDLKALGVADAGTYIASLDVMADSLSYLPAVASALTPEQALEVYRALDRLAQADWKAKAHLIGEMYQYRFPDKDLTARKLALGDAFSLQRSQVNDLIKVYAAFDGLLILDESPLSMSYFVTAAGTQDPEAWIKVATERKLANPSFRSADLREEIKRVEGIAVPEPGSDPVEPAKQMRWASWECPHCSEHHQGWVELLPVGSDGAVVDIESYR